MVEPLSITAGIVGISVAAIAGTRKLYKTLEKITNAPVTIQKLRQDVKQTLDALESIKIIENPDWDRLGPAVTRPFKDTIQKCAASCELFEEEIIRWTRKSPDGMLAMKTKTKINIGGFKHHQIEAMTKELQSCKLSSIHAISVMNLYLGLHQYRSNEVQQGPASIDAASRDVSVPISSAISLTDDDLAETDRALTYIRERNIGEQEEEEFDDWQNAIGQIERERDVLACSRRLLEELLSSAKAENIPAPTQSSSGDVHVGSASYSNVAHTIHGGTFHFGGQN